MESVNLGIELADFGIESADLSIESADLSTESAQYSTYSSHLYLWLIYQKKNRRGRNCPSGYWALDLIIP